MSLLWGLKTVAVFDVWSLVHILTGISLGSFLYLVHQRKLDAKHTLYVDIIAILCIAFLWEAIEFNMEIGLGGAAVKFWFFGIEHWANRLIADPLLLLVGYYFSRVYPVLVVPSRAISFLWLLLHIFVLPHSMYVQLLL